MRPFGATEFFFIVKALQWTAALSLAALLIGGIGGLLIATARIVPARAPRILAAGFIELFQGTPLLLQLFVAYFGLGLFGWNIDAWSAACAALSLHTAAFLGEIWRGCLQAIPKTQWEAGASLGLSMTAQLRYIIVPQALRLAIPPTVGFLVQLIKNTSLAAVIGFIELTREGQLTTATTFRPFTVYLIVAAIYFALCFPLTQWSRRLERRLHVAR